MYNSVAIQCKELLMCLRMIPNSSSVKVFSKVSLRMYTLSAASFPIINDVFGRVYH